MVEKYPWYEIVESEAPLKQGDFIMNCPVIIPPERFSQKDVVDVVLEPYDVVVMSQSCDLEHEKITIVLVCPFISLNEIKNEFFRGTNGKNSIRNQSVPGLLMLYKCEIEGFEMDYSVVDFHDVFGIHFSVLKQIAKAQKRRLRLLPPYVEHLSQAFAKFFIVYKV